jgi:hypothetical protein
MEDWEARQLRLLTRSAFHPSNLPFFQLEEM